MTRIQGLIVTFVDESTWIEVGGEVTFSRELVGVREEEIDLERLNFYLIYVMGN